MSDAEFLSLLPTLEHELEMRKKKENPTVEELLQIQVERLTRSLALERMRNRALEVAIEIAEQEEGISVLKKDGAKQ